MISYSVDGVVLDIEGTVSSIDFVHREMFPYVRRELDSFLVAHGAEPAVLAACQTIAREGGLPAFNQLIRDPGSCAETLSAIRAEVSRLMDADAKTTGLKELQGLIWQAGFDSGELVAPLFADVVPALRDWAKSGMKLFVYSSGSVAAQQLFFGHTEGGDLRPLFAGYFDTTTGPKREAESYRKIAASCQIAPQRLLFVSDIVAELEAALSAGFQVALSLRPGNSPQERAESWPSIKRFDEIDLSS